MGIYLTQMRKWKKLSQATKFLHDSFKKGVHYWQKYITDSNDYHHHHHCHNHFNDCLSTAG